jgi:hypothetical protein
VNLQDISESLRKCVSCVRWYRKQKYLSDLLVSPPNGIGTRGFWSA